MDKFPGKLKELQRCTLGTLVNAQKTSDNCHKTSENFAGNVMETFMELQRSVQKPQISKILDK